MKFSAIVIGALAAGAAGAPAAASAEDIVRFASAVAEGVGRPLFHFTPEEGWMNDPNGLVYADGEWRMFYQHTPGARGIALDNPWDKRLKEASAFYWGLATSPDLVHWTRHGDAVKPVPPCKVLMSGCSLLDRENAFGAGTNAQVVFACETWGDRQSGLSAYVSADGRRFTPYAGNPLYRSPTGRKGCDPSIVWHEPTQRWILVECLLDNDPWAVRFWSSPNLRDWRQESELAGDARSTTRLFLKEFPQLMAFPIEGEKGTAWVLWGANLRYAVGDFDGHAFTPKSGPLDWQMMPEGHEWWYHPYYTAQTYRNAPAGRYVTQSWLNTAYRGETYSQQMSLPLETSVVRTKDGLRLKMLPVRELDALRKGEPKPLSAFDAEGGEIRLKVRPGTDGRVRLNVRGIVFGWSAKDQRLTASCSRPVSWPVQADGTLALRVYVDRLSVEVFSQDGLRMRAVTEGIPDPKNRRVSVAVEGDAEIIEAKAWEMRAAPCADLDSEGTRTPANANQHKQ